MPAQESELDLLQQWIGRSESRAELIHPGPANALAATLDSPLVLHEGDSLPPLWHWIYFWTPAPASAIGADGHPLRGGFLPPVALPRRMWAGGRLQFHAPLPVGARAERISRVADVKVRQGASGTLVFVTVEHTIQSEGRPCLTEEHDIVYRDLPRPDAAPPAPKPAPAESQWTRLVDPDPVLLFRYSALTFNGHRIHYDRSYVTGTEGYPGLVVHGPLVATMLMQLAREALPERSVRSFAFRAISPLFDVEPFRLHGRLSDDGASVLLWATNARGELAMQAEAALH